MKQSEFTAGLASYVVHSLISGAIVFLTFGIATPWAIVYMKSWELENTVIDGQRLRFDGSAMDLFFQWIKWLLLTLITLGIYGFWVRIKMKQWVVENTHVDTRY